MPWDHCENTGILDDESCPGCGITKQAWTLEFNVTRDFVVKRKPLLRIRVLTPAEEPVPGVAFEVDLPDGETVSGELDEDGFAKVNSPRAGDCVARFPHRAPRSLTLAEEAADHASPVEEAEVATFTCPTGKKLELRQRVAFVVQTNDVLFDHDSALLMLDAPEHRVSGLGVLHATLRHAAALPQHRLLVAGHTDVSGEADYNLRLSRQRAEGVRDLLLGNREGWVALAREKGKVEDYQRILGWIHRSPTWSCDPGEPDGELGPRTRGAARSFQEHYNREYQRTISVDGEVGSQTWGAFFDVYRGALADLLQIDDATLSSRSESLHWVDDERRAVGCGESHPMSRDEHSQADRRVEILFFPDDDLPQLPCHARASCDPSACDVYGAFEWIELGVEGEADRTGTVTIPLQLVDVWGHPLPGAAFRTDGASPLEAEADEVGYAELQLAPGPFSVLHADGRLAHVIEDDERVEARLHTDVAQRTITLVVLNAELDTDSPERSRRRRLREHYQRPIGESDEPSSERLTAGADEEPPIPQRHRVLAVDNLGLVAFQRGGGGDADGYRRRLREVLDTWLSDYFPGIHRRGYFLTMIELGTSHSTFHLYEEGGTLGSFPCETLVIGLAGAYAPFRRSGAGFFFRDMGGRRRAVLRRLRPEGDLDLSELEDEEETPEEQQGTLIHLLVREGVDRNLYQSKVEERASTGRLHILYQSPFGAIGRVARAGGAGLLEDYGPQGGLNAHAHERNLDTVRTVRDVYDVYVRGYESQAGAVPDEAALRALGPPRPPYHFPRPAGATDRQWDELVAIQGEQAGAELNAWGTVSSTIDRIYGRHPEGEFWFTTKFVYRHPPDPDQSIYEGVEIEHNIEVSQSGEVRPGQATRTYERLTTPRIGFGGLADPIELLPVNGSIQHEVDQATGQEKTTVSARFPQIGTLSTSDDGDFSVSNAGFTAGGNWYERNMGVGYTIDLPMGASISLGLHFQSLRTDTVLRILSGAPGFFSRRSLNELLGPIVQWNDLRGDERAKLSVLDWEQETWDTKRSRMLIEFPETCITRFQRLTAEQKIAAVHLGFFSDQWQATWRQVSLDGGTSLANRRTDESSLPSVEGERRPPAG